MTRLQRYSRRRDLQLGLSGLRSAQPDRRRVRSKPRANGCSGIASYFKDDFYIELQDHEIDVLHNVNETAAGMAKEFGIPLIATNDVHYVKKEDADAHDLMLCIQTARCCLRKTA